MSLLHKKIGAALLATSTLGGGGAAYLVQQQDNLDNFISTSLDTAIKQPDSAELAARKAALAADGVRFLGKIDALNARESSLSTADAKRERAEIQQIDQRLFQVTHELYGNAQERLQQEANEILGNTNINTPVHVSVLPHPGANIVTQTVEVDNKPQIEVLITTAALDLYTPKEISFSLNHEILGHVLHDNTDELGNVLRKQNAVPDDPVRRRLMGLSPEEYTVIAREERADREAIRATCDPVSAASLLAKSRIRSDMSPSTLQYALDNKLPIDSEAEGFASRLEQGIRSSLDIPATVKANSVFGGKSHLQVYPSWKHRIQQIRDTAAKDCPAER